jgi:hypothetical protein
VRRKSLRNEVGGEGTGGGSKKTRSHFFLNLERERLICARARSQASNSF